MGLITFPLLLLVLVAIFMYFYKNYKERHPNFPPGPPRLPIYGSYWFLLKENYYFTHKAVQAWTKKYKSDVLGMYLGNFPTVIAVSHKMVKEVLTREEFNGRNNTYFTRTRSLGERWGLFFVDGPNWKEQRRFVLRHLRDFGFGRRYQESELFYEAEIGDFIKFLTSNPNENDREVCREQGKVLFPDVFYAPLLNIILQFLVGRRFENKELREIGRGLLRFLQGSDTTGNALTITPWLRYISRDLFGYASIYDENKRLFDFFKRIIDERSAAFTEGHNSDFLDVYLNQLKSDEDSKNSSFSVQQMMWVLIDIMFPAPSTIPFVLTYMFAYLINYPDLQHKVREEIHRVVGKSRFPNLNDRQNMPFTEAFIKEVLRKEPLVPIITPRRCVQETLLGGFTIPKDTLIMPCQFTSNHDPDIWEQPYEFKPERFLDKNGSLIKQDDSFPFGAGKRVCVGETFSRQLLFLITAGLLQHFTFKEVDKMPEIENKSGGFVVCMAEFWAEAVLS